MRVSGFTLVRNGTRFEYPFVESIRSMLPVVDELVVNVGVGDDDTLARVQELARAARVPVTVFESRWPLDDPERMRSGMILSEQTNLALDRCTGDWCLYLQADEVLHEADHPALRGALSAADPRSDVDGLLFDYVHFYGSFDVVQQSRSAYRREVRAVRRSSGTRSVGDAQSFRLDGGAKPRVVRSGARVYHYGWVRAPETMRVKTAFMDRLYHGAAGGTGDNYRYKRIWGLKRFNGSHPTVMRERIAAKGWHWDLAGSPLAWTWRDSKKVALDLFERATGVRPFEYRSYRLLGDR